MSHPKYHRWPRPSEYAEGSEIVSYWPRLQGTMYCIAPAINVTWVNTWDDTNPPGTYVWSQRLRMNSGTRWDYGSFSFSADSDYQLYIENIQLLDWRYFWRWVVNVRVIRYGVMETADGMASRDFWPVTRLPEPWSQEIEVVLRKEWSPSRSISLWCRPCTVEDMVPNSYEPLLGD